MKRFLLSFCFIAFLSAGLVSCEDGAAEVMPSQPELSAPTLMTEGGTSGKPERP